MEWNTNSTALKGLEWGPTVSGGVVLDAFTKSACMSWRQSTSQAIGTGRVWVGAIPGRGGRYAVELYDGETCVPAAATTLTAYPNADYAPNVGTSANYWREDDGTTTSIYTEIDETSDDGQYIYTVGGVGGTNPNPLSVTPALYYGQMNTGGLSLGSQSILSVRLVVILKRGASSASAAWIGLNFASGGDFGGQYGIPPTTYTAFSTTWATNPATGVPWTVADVQLFDTTGYWWVAGGGNTTNDVTYVERAYMEVLTVPENRLALGTLDDSVSALTPNAWNAVTLLTPTGGTWTKDSTGWHTALIRRTSSVGSLVIPTLAAAEHPYPAEGWTPTLDSTYGYATAMGSVKPDLFGMILRTTAPAESVDSQPYTVQIPALVKSGQDAEQELSNLAVSNYGGVRAWVKSNNATQDLLIKVKRRSDNVQVGQTITVSKVAADALDIEGGGWRQLEVQMATGFTAGTATQYYVEFSSAAVGTLSPVFDYWSVLGVDTGDQGNGATFGGTTDRAVVNGTEADRYELAATLWTIPAAPTGLTTVIDTQEMPEWTADDSEGCLPLIIEYVHVSWTATTLAGQFDHYELARSEDGGSTWVTIGTISVEATVTFDDYETERGVAARYRLRVWRTDDARSDWTATATAPAATPVRCELLFTTNADPTLNCAYNRQGPDAMEFEFLDAEDVVFQKIYGRDYQLAFLGTERRGVRFSVPLIINAVREPTVTNEGLPLFQALRDLSTADVPYVCVLDHHGNRWFAELQVSGGSHTERGRIYIGQVTVTEVSGEPTPVEVV